MSKPKAPLTQYKKTQALLNELFKLSKMKLWKDLYVEIEKKHPGIVTGRSHLGMLVNGHRFLTDANLYQIAEWAKSKHWAGKEARAALNYVAPSEGDLLADKQLKKSEQYNKSVDSMNIVKASKTLRNTTVAALGDALAKMSPAGFSNSDVMYMVHSWLTKNPETSKRGKRQRQLAGWDLSMGGGLSMPLEPDVLPKNFVIEEHLNKGLLFFLYTFHIPEKDMRQAMSALSKSAQKEEQQAQPKKPTTKSAPQSVTKKSAKPKADKKSPAKRTPYPQ